MNKLIIIVAVTIAYFCMSNSLFGQNMITSDIENFWNAHDKIVAEKDYEKQITLINDLYINKGTPGLKAIMRARRYSDRSYVDAINKYPKFWRSVRKNTYKAKTFAKEIENGVERLKLIYPELEPAKVYFTIGVFRTPGTTLEGMVLIGSEMALTDDNTDISEFPESFAGLTPYFKSNPINEITFLNVHEFVHTQQKEANESELLTQTLREGVAEFIAVKAMNIVSPTPSIAFGKVNRFKIKNSFTKEMFSHYYDHWLWNNFDNKFKMRDLGYFVGYDIAETYYENSIDKTRAVKDLIELDYQDDKAVANLVNKAAYFSNSIEEYRRAYENSRPQVSRIIQFKNNDQNVDSNLRTITFEFSHEMDPDHRGFDFGPLGERNVLLVKRVIGFSEDRKSLSIEVELKANQRYQMTLTDIFRDSDGVSLKPCLVDIRTRK